MSTAPASPPPEVDVPEDRSFPVPVTRWLAAVAALAVLAALALLAVWDVSPPSPRAANAPDGEFSAERAYRHVERVGAKVHVAGSPAAAEVRDYLAETLRGYGLDTEIQETTGLNGGKIGDGNLCRVQNVIGFLPGKESTGRVILVAHYDSVQISYGGNDDGAGVGTLLETARALAGQPQPRNDVVFLFTDAEEAGLCGAEAFVSQHRFGRDGGVVLNFEARGSSGPAVMFETSKGNAGLVGVYGRVAPYPVGTSVAVEVYRLLPNDTDFTPFLLQDRFTGLNAAYIDGSSRYHTPQDTPSNMDRQSLQHHGDNALALTRELGDVDLAPLRSQSGGDATYFPVPGLLIRYPGGLVWPIAVLALLAVAGLAFVARRRSLTSWPRAAAGFGLALLPIVGAAVVAQALWAVLVMIRPGYAEMIDPHRPGWFRWAVLALVLATLLTWYGLLRRRIGAVSLAIGALGWLAVLGLVLAAFAPGGSYLTALPALFGAAAGIGALYVRQPWVRLAVLVAGGAVAVFVLAPTVSLFFPALGLATGAAPALFAMLLGMALLPLLEFVYPDVPASAARRRRRLIGAAPAAVAAVLAVLFAGVGLAVDGFDEAHPLPTHLMYALDADTGKAQWISREASPSEWTRRHVSRDVEGESVTRQFPVLDSLDRFTVGDAPAAQLTAPQVDVVSDSTSGSERTLRLRLRSARQVRLVALHLEPGEAARSLRLTVAGREVPSSVIGEAGRPGFVYHGPQAEGIEVTLVVPAGPLRVRVSDGSDGLDGLPGLTPRPKDVSAVGSHSSDLVLVARTVTL